LLNEGWNREKLGFSVYLLFYVLLLFTIIYNTVYIYSIRYYNRYLNSFGFNSQMDSQSEKLKWLSLKDAAEYLDVGEQTLYRWMKESKITYRKVGDSIRFLREDLDAVIEVHHSKKSASEVREICPQCHHDELIEGVVQGTGKVYFRPKKTKFWTFRDSNVDTRSFMCSRCGSIFWFGDTTKLESLKIKTKESAEK
jgi:excisionase family DNA binding protein